MIKKFTKEEIESVWEEPLAGNIQSIYGKINELCDVVNEQQKQIDKMSFAILDLATPNGENKALESIKAESNQSDCPEQMGYIKLDSDSLATFLKIHPQYNKNGVLELDRTRKALYVAVDALRKLNEELYNNNFADSYCSIAEDALEQITALEQKDVK